MIRKIISLVLVITLLSTLGVGFEKTGEKNDEEYKRFNEKLLSLYKNKKYLEAARVLEKNYEKFPNETQNMIINATFMYINVNKLNTAIKMLEQALKKGIFINKHIFDEKPFSSLKKLRNFTKILALNEQKRTEAEKIAKPKYELVFPEKYDKEKKYPLFIALHGGDENIKKFKPKWKSNLLQKNFITAYVQSSQVSSLNGYHWEDLKKTEKEIKYLYDIIRSKYLINKKRILIGGFSSGGHGSLYSAFKQVLPIKGYVVLCPVIPKNVDLSDIKRVMLTELSGTIITSDTDSFFKTQKDFSNLLKKEGIRNKLVITPNIGHRFPKDLSNKLDKSIKFIFKN